MCFIFISVIDVVAVVFEMEKKLVWKKKKNFISQHSTVSEFPTHLQRRCTISNKLVQLTTGTG